VVLWRDIWVCWSMIFVLLDSESIYNSIAFLPAIVMLLME
jgi:hypothetical protein